MDITINTEQHKPTLRVVRVLETIASSPAGLTLSKIATQLNYPKSTLTPILKTLVDLNFLACDENTLIYTMGKQAFVIGNTYQHDSDILSLVQDQMETMSALCKETIHLGVLEGNQIMYLQKVSSPKPLQLISSVGKRLPAYATALGKALLFDKTKDELAQLFPEPLEPLTEKTITTLDALFEDIHKDIHQEFTYEEEEITKYARCIAKPLRVNGQIVAALSISFIIFDGTTEHINNIKSILKNYSTIIEKLLANKEFYY